MNELMNVSRPFGRSWSKTKVLSIAYPIAHGIFGLSDTPGGGGGGGGERLELATYKAMFPAFGWNEVAYRLRYKSKSG